MTAPEIYKSIATDGLTGTNRNAFQALPNSERLGLWKALAQDYPDIARELRQGLPRDDEAEAGVVEANKEQAQGVDLSLNQPATAHTSTAPVDSIQDEEVHHDPVQPELNAPSVEPSAPKTGKLPVGFPGKSVLEAEGLDTYEDVRRELKKNHGLVHLNGIADVLEGRIREALG